MSNFEFSIFLPSVRVRRLEYYRIQVQDDLEQLSEFGISKRRRVGAGYSFWEVLFVFYHTGHVSSSIFSVGRFYDDK